MSDSKEIGSYFFDFNKFYSIITQKPKSTTLQLNEMLSSSGRKEM